jgi:hypothetical protein
MKTKTLFSACHVASLTAALFLAFGDSTHATTINWGTYISPSSYLFDSAGTNLDDNYVFELGTFGLFNPTTVNMSDWLANWKVFDRATAPGTNGWNSGSGIVAHSATAIDQPATPDLTDSLSDNASLPANTFNQNEQAYIWVYKDTFGNPNPSPTYGAALQWALVTNNSTDGIPADDWLFPPPSGHVVSTLDWRIEDATATPFGGLNNVEGAGDFSSTPPDFILQTHTVAAVPEPSSALFVGLAGVLMMLRRSKRMAAQS